MNISNHVFVCLVSNYKFLGDHYRIFKTQPLNNVNSWRLHQTPSFAGKYLCRLRVVRLAFPSVKSPGIFVIKVK